MPIEALFNEMNHAHKTVGVDEKKSSIADASPKTDLGRGEKKFVEINTNEQLIISTIGAFGAPKNSDRFMPLTSFK